MVSLSLIATGLVMSLIRLSETQGWLILAGMVSFIFFFAIGSGAYMLVIMSELLPGAIRSKALNIALFLNSTASAILASVFLLINNFLGHGSMFYICGICTFSI